MSGHGHDPVIADDASADGSPRGSPRPKPAADPLTTNVTVSGNPSRLPAVARIVGFDIVGPLALYTWLRSQGWSAVTSLVTSGALPAVGVIVEIARRRRIDVIGAVVLLGVVVGTTLGLASGSARLVLLEGSVPTAIFGAVCLGSLWTSRPLMYRFAVEFVGEDTPRGRNSPTTGATPVSGTPSR